MSPNVEALIAVIHDLRPDWSPPAIRAALLLPEVRARTYAETVAAAVALARDPASRAPGRLAHGGPWWPPPGSAGTHTPPPYRRPRRPADPAAVARGVAEARAELARAADRRATRMPPGGDRGAADGLKAPSGPPEPSAPTSGAQRGSQSLEASR